MQTNAKYSKKLDGEIPQFYTHKEGIVGHFLVSLGISFLHLFLFFE